jgi:hypothetical protein
VTRVFGDGVEEMKEVKMVAKIKLSHPGLLGEIYRRRSAKLEVNHDIKSLPSLKISSGYSSYGPYACAYRSYALYRCDRRLQLVLWFVG